MTEQPLNFVDLAAAASLLVINGVLSWAFRLGLERSIAIAAVRMMAQLGAVGFVLKIAFEQGSPALTTLLAAVMILMAGLEVATRQEGGAPYWATYGIGTATLFFVGIIATLYTLRAIIRPEPWFSARYVLPILGMILGNALTAVALVLNTLVQTVSRERTAIEARIALGATRFDAMSTALSGAVRTGLIPVLNSMAATGVVSLPGMMTGQILAGAEPTEAAKYQIIIMFVLSGASALAATLSAIFGVYLLTDTRHRLRLDRLRHS